jgi:hypothetical protein
MENHLASIPQPTQSPTVILPSSRFYFTRSLALLSSPAAAPPLPLTFARLSFVSGQTGGGIFGIFHPQTTYCRSPLHPPDFYDFCICEEVVSALLMGLGAHRDAPTSGSGAVGEGESL